MKEYLAFMLIAFAIVLIYSLLTIIHYWIKSLFEKDENKDIIRYKSLKDKALQGELEAFVALNQLDYCYSEIEIDKTIDELLKNQAE